MRIALGAPFMGLAPRLLSGCGPGRGVPEGELLDFGRARAHAALRDSRGMTLANMPADIARERRGVVVVGGGVAGLAAAWRLVGEGGLGERGDVLVCELEDVVGGTARAGRSELSAFPWGAHYVVAPFSEDRAMVRLLGEMGCFEGVDRHGHPNAAEGAAVRELEERHFFEGRFSAGLYPGDGETAEEKAERERFGRRMDALAGAVSARGRAFTLPVSQVAEVDGVDAAALDRMTFAAWLEAEGFRSWRLEWLCDYACRDDYGTSAAACSAWAGLLYFIARRRPEVGLEDRAVITWPEGNGRVVEHLARQVGATRIETGAMVLDVEADDAGARVLVVDRAGRARVIACDSVIVATPRHVARHVVRAYREAPPAWMDAFTTAPWVVVNLHLSRRPETVGVAQAWDTVFIGSASVGYVDAQHQRGRDHGPTVWTWYRPLFEAGEVRKQCEAVGREGWVEAALSELELGHPDIRRCVVRADVGRLGHGMVRPVPGLRRHLESARVAPHPRVRVAHTDLSGVALCEEAVDHGLRAAEEVLAARGGDVRSWR
ncbi:MAG: FAD-dependent oxidoreductase [Deltaproteobacteria bacterium]|nr:FAD-dependent oxidoreductase [Deltaproteobacteria bacterium]